ncbi:hypothetical protein JCM14469_38900 [Desulfatiferula olefinivorans]
MRRDRVLVVLTTSDYIDLLDRAAPGRLLFMTFHAVRRDALEPAPSPEDEVLVDPGCPETAVIRLKQHLGAHGLALSGLVCYDCESMDLAARIAQVMGLSYPSPESIRACRDKSRTAALWQAHKVPCPRSETVCSPRQVRNFFETVRGPCVLKPVDGSGSEHVFRCADEAEGRRALDLIAASPRSHGVLMQECVDGVEYSCDFIVDGEKTAVVRVARKIHEPDAPFGTIMAYELIEWLPAPIDRNEFTALLGRAARSLGITRAICMVDFIIRDGAPVFLELAPRPGGDCLPWLIRRALGLDMLTLAVDVAEQGISAFVSPPPCSAHVGLRIHAHRSGVLKGIDPRRLREDPRVIDVFFKHPAGHTIVLPPDDYDSWNLGHIVFTPRGPDEPARQCRDLLSLLTIEIDHDTPCSGPNACGSHPNRPVDDAFQAAG